MAEEGIKAESVFSCEYPTAAAQVQLDGNGQNRICVISSANFRFGMNEVEKIDEKLRETEIVLLQLELSGKTYAAAYDVKVADTVAAGDSFNGALAVAIAEGKNDEEILRFANAMGALTVSKNGAIPSICTRKELEVFLKERVY